MVYMNEEEIDRIASVVQMNCAASGGCMVYHNNEGLTCAMGDKQLVYINQEEGRSRENIKNIIRRELQKVA